MLFDMLYNVGSKLSDQSPVFYTLFYQYGFSLLVHLSNAACSALHNSFTCSANPWG